MSKFTFSNNDEQFDYDSYDSRESALEQGKKDYPDSEIIYTGEKSPITVESLLQGMADHITDAIECDLDCEHHEGASDNFKALTDKQSKELETILINFFKKIYPGEDPFGFDVINVKEHKL